MKDKTQDNRIIGQLLKTGIIYRNDCLRNFISRLGSIIKRLEHKGWEFEDRGYTEDGKDYYYRFTKCPLKLVQRKLPTGEIIITYEK